jgi:hypothetical protein
VKERTKPDDETPASTETQRPPSASARVPRTGIFRWSSRPGEAASAASGTPRARGPEPLSVLLRWTEDLDDERAVTLWSGLSAVEDPQAREAALLRWIDWAGVAIPLGVKLRDLVKAVGRLLNELSMLVADADRVQALDPLDLAPVTRALLGWLRAREAQPGVVLGAALSIVQAAETLRASEAAPSAPVAIPMLLAALRRRMERAPTEECAELLAVYLRADPPASMAPWAAMHLEFALLAGDLRGHYAPALARLPFVAPAVWRDLLGRREAPRDTLRAMRLLAALAQHDQLARALPEEAARVAADALVAGLEHPRFRVWSLAARSLGRLAGPMPAAHRALSSLLALEGATLLRRRAFAALGNVGPEGDPALQAHRDAVIAAVERPVTEGDASTSVHTVETGAWSLSLASQVAAFAVSLPDHVAQGDPRWSALATAFAERGGPDAWLAVARAMQEVALRQPHALDAARAVAASVQAKAIGVRASSADNERAERAEAITVRLVHLDAPRAPQALLAELAHAVGQSPSAPDVRALVDGCGTELDAVISRAVRSLAREDSRDAAQGSLALEEVVDLVVDGDLEVLAHHLGEVPARTAALALVDALRDRLLKMVWSGLRRSTPAAAAWRRWLLRSATVLPRVPPTNRHVAAETVRDQVLETLERVAEDPMVGQRPLERHVAAALVELAAALTPSLGPGAIGAVMTWMSLRGVMGPTQVRLRRWISDDVAGDRVQGWFRLVELMARSGRDAAEDLAALQAMVGDRCRLGRTLGELSASCASLIGRRPEDHWSGLPRFDLTDFARVADAFTRLTLDATFALSLDRERATPASRTVHATTAPLSERAAQLDRLLTSTSLKFVDAARRAEVVEHYIGELGALCEAIASGCGPLLSGLVRGALARAMVAVRAMAADAVRTETTGSRHIGRLRVLGELSSAHEGGMASTFIAEGPAPGKRVVVKLLPWAGMRGTSAETSRALFEGEMERLARVVHPNIVSIVDAGFVDEGAYIALEYIPGASLETLLTRLGRLSPTALAPIIRDVARALAHLHTRGVLHRDVKPANLLAQFELPDGAELTAETLSRAELIRAVLIDFGIATEASRAGAHEGITGTPGYIAPEVVRGIEPFGPAVDVYALAVVVFEMLCGANPFLAGEPDLETVMVRHGSVALPWSELPEMNNRAALVKLLQDATRMDPQRRPSMRVFLHRWVELSAEF